MADKCKSAESGSGFMNFIWNPERKEFCGRTGISWLKILVFYVIFYICLAAFWALMLLIFYQTIDQSKPKWTLDDSRIGSNPGLGFRPRPPVDKVDSTLIRFTSGTDNTTWKHYFSDLDKFIELYKKDAGDSGEAVASESDCNSGAKISSSKFCPFDVKNINGEGERCTKANYYGYSEGKPCILIKLNKIYGWSPIPISQERMEKEKFPGLPYTGDREGVIITCEGENPADKENIGTIKYSPTQLLPKKHYPYTNQPGYLSPFVMIQLQNPHKGTLINVECKAWANNIKHDRSEREGSVHFEVMID
jgi:sodium/potassium-transporting ATPase subunit beta